MKTKCLGWALFILLIAGLIAPVFGQNSFFIAEDKAAPFQVRYSGPNDAYVGIGADGKTFTLKDGDRTTSVTFTPSYTLSTLIGVINANTNNTDEKRYWEAYKWAGLNADTTSNAFVAATTNLLEPNIWQSPMTWDTSAVKRYDVVPDTMTGNRPMGAYVITGVMGDPAGTGTQVLKVYNNEALVYQKTFTQIYTQPEVVNYAGVSTNTAISMQIDAGSGEFPRIRIDPGRRGLIRVERGSSATGGGVGATTDVR